MQVASGCMLMLFTCLGCGEKPDMPDMSKSGSGKAASVERASPDHLSLPSGDASRPDARPLKAVVEKPGPQPAAAELPPTVRVAALMKRLNGDVSVGLVGKNEEQHALVGIGDQFMGYEVVAADVSKGEVVLEHKGTRYTLMLEGSAIPSVGNKTPDGKDMQTASGDDLQQASAMMEGLAAPPVVQSFEATPAEKRLGIDPNDSSTWTPGYRGPAIERAATAKIQYEPTPDESQRGIDPNEPTTWPEDYRGPGIERLATEAAAQPQEGPDEAR